MTSPCITGVRTFVLTGGLACMLLATQAAAASRGLWTSAAELAAVPAAGPAWETLVRRAGEDQSKPDVSDQNDDTNIRVLASAIVFARTGDEAARARVIGALHILEAGGQPRGRTLAWSRETGAYALAADLVDYQSPVFSAWLRAMAEKYRAEDGRTMLEMFRLRPNNWGMHAFGSLTAIYAYLGDAARLHEIREHYVAGVLGTNRIYEFGHDLSWHADPAHPRLVNPAGAVKVGLNIDGVQPDDLRRGAPFHNPPKFTNYVWEGLQGQVMAARLFARLGQPIWDVGDRAIYRTAYRYEVGFAGLFGDEWKASGDDEWMLAFFDVAYGSHWGAGQPRLWECANESINHSSESLLDRIRRSAVERLGHGRGPRGPTGKHDRILNQSAATKVNPIV